MPEATQRAFAIEAVTDRKRRARAPPRRSMDDQHVAMRAPLDVLADAQAEEPRDQPGLARPDDDHVGVPLFGSRQDHVGRVTDSDVVRRLDSQPVEHGPCVTELLSMQVRRIDRVDRPDPVGGGRQDLGCADRDDRRIERLGELNDAPQGTLADSESS